MKQTRQDFFTANGEGIKIMTFTEFARHILRMECGESLELYAVVNRQTRECSRPLSVRKEQWNGTPFYLLGGHGQEVRTINFAGRPKEEFIFINTHTDLLFLLMNKLYKEYIFL